MARWPKDELRQIAAADDLHISPFREDGVTYGTPTWIWSVAVGAHTQVVANAAGRDPRDYLLELLGPPRHVDPTRGGVQDWWNYGDPVELYPIDTARHRRVVEVVAQHAGWGRALPACN